MPHFRSPVEQYLQRHAQPMPGWLQRGNAALAFSSRNLQRLLRGRTLYYPGAGNDGLPLKVFARSGSAHGFVYSDYSFGQDCSLAAIKAKLQPVHACLDQDWTPAIRGYWPIVSEIIDPFQFLRVITQLLGNEDRTFWDSSVYRFDRDFLNKMLELQNRMPQLEAHEKSGYFHLFTRYDLSFSSEFLGVLWTVLERDSRLSELHGPERIVLLYVSADAYWCYWLLYGLFCRPPFAVVVQDHGFGGNYSRFGGAKSPLLSLTQMTGLPPWILRGNRSTCPWPGYRTLPGEVGPSRDTRNIRVLEEKVRDLRWR